TRRSSVRRLRRGGPASRGRRLGRRAWSARPCSAASPGRRPCRRTGRAGKRCGCPATATGATPSCSTSSGTWLAPRGRAACPRSGSAISRSRGVGRCHSATPATKRASTSMSGSICRPKSAPRPRRGRTFGWRPSCCRTRPAFRLGCGCRATPRSSAWRRRRPEWTGCWSTTPSSASSAARTRAPLGCAGSGPGAATTPTCTCACAARPAKRSAETRPRRRQGTAVTPLWLGGSPRKRGSRRRAPRPPNRRRLYRPPAPRFCTRHRFA
ncbi:MAG: Penicillin-insensitive murein endopeptidase, partial [uncultured Acetobacteraceae bacterium]